MNYLEANWQKIRKKIIVPLWNGKFKSMYERAKMDYDDFESLAAIELTKAMKTFNPAKSNLFTYATNVINKKAMTELRDCTQRDVRKTLYISDSVDALDNSIVDNLTYDNNSSDFLEDELSEKMVKYLNRLSKLQREILYALADGYTTNEIVIKLNISQKEMFNACEAIKAYRNVSILF